MVVVEEFIVGTELAIGMITTSEGTRVLPAVEIRPVGGVYDYSAMYTGGETRLTAPADISDTAAQTATAMARVVQKELDFSGISRVDAIVDESGRPVFLEAGAAPGMTATSLVPVAMKAPGLDLPPRRARQAGICRLARRRPCQCDGLPRTVADERF